MKVYKDIFSGDELLSDAFEVKTVDDIVYEVETKMVTVGNDGANIPGEEGEVDDPTDVKVLNIVGAHRLVETNFDKKQFMIYIKGYMKRISDNLEANNPARKPIFMAAAANYVKGVLANFSEYGFYTGETMDPEAAVALTIYRGEAATPNFIFFKDGLVEEKY